MEILKQKILFAADDEESVIMHICTERGIGGLILIENKHIIEFGIYEVDDIDKIVSALNVLRNDMLNEDKTTKMTQ